MADLLLTTRQLAPTLAALPGNRAPDEAGWSAAVRHVAVEGDPVRLADIERAEAPLDSGSQMAGRRANVPGPGNRRVSPDAL